MSRDPFRNYDQWLEPDEDPDEVVCESCRLPICRCDEMYDAMKDRLAEERLGVEGQSPRERDAEFEAIVDAIRGDA